MLAVGYKPSLKALMPRFCAQPKPVPDTFWSKQPKTGDNLPPIVSFEQDTHPGFIAYVKALLKGLPGFITTYLAQKEQKIVACPMLEAVHKDFEVVADRTFWQEKLDAGESPPQNTGDRAAAGITHNTIHLPQYVRLWSVDEQKRLYYWMLDQIFISKIKMRGFILHEVGHFVLAGHYPSEEIRQSISTGLCEAFERDIKRAKEQKIPFAYAMTDPVEAFCEVFASVINNPRLRKLNDYSLRTLAQAKQVMPEVTRFVLDKALPMFFPEVIKSQCADKAS